MQKGIFLSENLRYYTRRYFESLSSFWGKLSPSLRLPQIALFLILAGVLAGFAILKWGMTEMIETSISPLDEGQNLSDLWFASDGRLVGVRREGWKITIQTWDGMERRPKSTRTIDLDLLTPVESPPQKPSVEKQSKLGGEIPYASPLAQSPVQQSLAQRLPIRRLGERASALQQTTQPRLPRTTQQLPLTVSRDASRIAWVWSGKLYLTDLSLERKPLSGRQVDLAKPVAALEFINNKLVVIRYENNEVVFKDIEKGGEVKAVKIPGPCGIGSSGTFVLHACGGMDKIIVYDASQYPRISQREYSFKSSVGILPVLSSAGHPALATEKGTVLLRSSRGESNSLDIVLIAPGVVERLEFYDESRVVVAGGFRGIYLLGEDTPQQEVVAGVAGTRSLAVSRPRLAYATIDQTRLATLRSVDKINPTGQTIAAAWAVLVVGFLVAPAILLISEEMEKKQERRWRTAFESRAATAPETEAPALPLPEPPEALMNSCAGGECVAYVGAGLSAQAGFPTWQTFIPELLEWAIKEQLITDPRFAQSLRAALERGLLDQVADNIVSILRGREKDFYDYLFRTFVAPQSPLPAAHRFLREIPFSAVLTTNFDTLLERTFEDRRVPAFTHRDAEPLLEALTRHEFFLLKLYGSLKQPETVLLAPAQFLEAVAKNSRFSRFMESLFFSKTILFVGASLEGIEAYLTGITFRGVMPHPHYALVGVAGTAWQSKAYLLRERYNIEVLPYTPSPGYPQAPQFLEKLARAVKAKIGEQAQPVRETARLKSVTLENIGPFDNLTLNLDPTWNILLGDNGVGKSTILKAIAVAICGKEAEPYAGRLIKSGSDRDDGVIILETDQGKKYVIIIERRDAGAEVKSPTSRPLEAEGWLVLGFPPLRGGTWTRPKSPPPEGLGRPSAEDVLPLVKGDPDPRLDKLKDWIVRLDNQINRSKAEAKGKPSKSLYEDQLDELFRIIGQLTPGLKLEYGGVNDRTYEVSVITDDGKIPIELVSQGTTSLLSWIGHLLQRLYDFYGTKDGATEQPQMNSGSEIPPRQRYALVLIDEIDAHMHPAWQRTVIHLLSGLFPNVQFIATTHSPLIVGGMPPEQVVLLQRKDKVVQIPLGERTMMGGTDQILTSRLFSMESTVDPITEEAIAEYQRLAAISSRTSEQEKRYQELRRTLEFRVPATGPSPIESQAKEVLEALLLEQFGDKFPEARQKALAAAQELFEELRDKQEKKR